MRLLLYSGKQDEITDFLMREMRKLILGGPIDVCRTIEAFHHRLTTLGSSPDIAVIMIRWKKELGMLVSLKELLADVDSIVILPDREDETISQGHKLYPRFLTYMDGDLGDVGDVLKKMIGRLNRERGSWSSDPLIEWVSSALSLFSSRSS